MDSSGDGVVLVVPVIKGLKRKLLVIPAIAFVFARVVVLASGHWRSSLILILRDVGHSWAYMGRVDNGLWAG